MTCAFPSFFFSQEPIGFKNQRDCLAQILAGFFERLALGIRPRQFLDESNVATLGRLLHARVRRLSAMGASPVASQFSGTMSGSGHT
jgi:hypothetical protein